MKSLQVKYNTKGRKIKWEEVEAVLAAVEEDLAEAGLPVDFREVDVLREDFQEEDHLEVLDIDLTMEGHDIMDLVFLDHATMEVVAVAVEEQ